MGWNDLVDWFASDDGWRILSGAIIPFVAIVVAGLIGAGIARDASRRVIAQHDRDARTTAVAALVAAGTNASRWRQQGPAAREHGELLAAQADIATRLLPASGASLAADWAERQLAAMRAAPEGTPVDDVLDAYRERLTRWLHRPQKARKLFATDLDIGSPLI